MPEDLLNFGLALAVRELAAQVEQLPKREQVHSLAEAAVEGSAHDAVRSLSKNFGPLFKEIAKASTSLLSTGEDESEEQTEQAA